MPQRAGLAVFALTAALALSVGVTGASRQEKLSGNDAYRVKSMLRDAHASVKKYYFDPTFKGLDWDAQYAEHLARVDQAPNLSAALSLVAGLLDSLNDSHTFFTPPAWSRRVDYGYDIGFVGDHPYIVAVRPQTDAATKLAPGDRILTINNNPVTRENVSRMQYILNVLSPMVGTRVEVERPDGTRQAVVVNSKVTDGRAIDTIGGTTGIRLSELIREFEDAQHAIRHRSAIVGPVFVWKAPTFMGEAAEIDRMAGRARAHSAVVLDLRGNPGGFVDAMIRLVGNMFDRDVKIGTRVARGGRAPIVARTRRTRAYTGALTVLVDAASASSAELFARVIQLEGRGTVIGDRTAGAVREARMLPFVQGTDTVITYFVTVTTADILMTDGISLERRGVIPDDLQLPSAHDLSARIDPVLAYAITKAGGQIDGAAAAKLFPPDNNIR